MSKAALALVILWLSALGPAWADCKLHRGQRVVLYSRSDDPSVLLWDSRARLREYHAASFDVAQAILPHALLVAPGTRATVVSCFAKVVESPIFHAPDDAIGVLISSGSQHGITRWVLGSDARPANR